MKQMSLRCVVKKAGRGRGLQTGAGELRP